MRRVALIAFNSAAHNKPSLIRDLLDSVLPQLYNETKVRVSSVIVTLHCNGNFLIDLLRLQKELVREVEMGPFKHTVDDGLDLRKAAFECMYTLLDSCLDRLDVFEFLNHVELGLKGLFIKFCSIAGCSLSNLTVRRSQRHKNANILDGCPFGHALSNCCSSASRSAGRTPTYHLHC